jgi:hypothetical protein
VNNKLATEYLGLGRTLAILAVCSEDDTQPIYIYLNVKHVAQASRAADKQLSVLSLYSSGSQPLRDHIPSKLHFL